MIPDLIGCLPLLPQQLNQLPAKCRLDHSRITCRATDRACGYTRQGGEGGKSLSHFLCKKIPAMCGCICGQLAVLLFSSDWVTTGTSYFCLVEPFFFFLKVVPHASLSMDGFLHLPPFIPQQGDVTPLCHSRISWRNPVLNKTRHRTSACDRIQIALLPTSLLCYRCRVRNMHFTLRLLCVVIHPGARFPLIIATAHVVWLKFFICS